MVYNDHMTDMFAQTRGAVGVFVSTSLLDSTLGQEDEIEFFLAVAAALQLLWKIQDMLQEYTRLAKSEQYVVDANGTQTSDGDNYVGNWKILSIVYNLVEQFHSVTIYVMVKLITDLAVAAGNSTISSTASTVLAVTTFVIVDVASKSRYRSVYERGVPDKQADRIIADIKDNKRAALRWLPTTV